MMSQTNFEVSPYGNCLVFKRGYDKSIVHELIRNNHLDGLRVNTREEQISDLGFLSEYEFLESLVISGVDDLDWNFLPALTGLKRLSIAIFGKLPIDLSRLSNLVDLAIYWRKGRVSGLEACKNITSLCLIYYKEENLSPIPPLKYLRDLKIKTSSVKSLDGIERFVSLDTLQIGNCRDLVNLEGIDSLANLSSLMFDKCSKVRSFEKVGSLGRLETLHLTDCKGVESIMFVEKLPSLEELALVGNTDVLDGDLLAAKHIARLFYKRKKHYFNLPATDSR